MGYALIAAGELLAFCKKHNKYIMFVLVVIAWLIFSFNSDNPDLGNYQAQYYGATTLYTEPLYVLLQKLCLKAGCSFQEFLCLEAALGLVVTAIAISMLSPYPNVVFGLYLIFPFFIDVVQVRSFFAQAFILVALIFLLKYQGERLHKYILYFILFVAIATGFHYSAVLFLPLSMLFLDIKKHKALVYVCLPLGILLLPIIIVVLSPLIAKIIGVRKAFVWLQIDFSMNFKMLRIAAVRIVLLIILFLVWKTVYRERFSVSLSESNPEQQEIFKTYEEDRALFLSIIIMFFFISFELFISGQYNRLSRTNLIIAYVLYSRLVSLIKNKTNARYLWGVIILYSVLCVADTVFFTTMPRTGLTWFTEVFKKVMEQNRLWNWLLQ